MTTTTTNKMTTWLDLRNNKDDNNEYIDNLLFLIAPSLDCGQSSVNLAALDWIFLLSINSRALRRRRDPPAFVRRVGGILSDRLNRRHDYDIVYQG